MKRLISVWLGVLTVLFCSLRVSSAQDYRGIQITTKDGEVLQPFGESWAVIIGVDDYRNVGKLRFAVNDAQAVKQLLQDKFGFAPEHILTFYDSQATKKEILHTLGDILPNKIGERDRLLVYFAGHGETYLDNGYLIPVDFARGEYRGSAISMTELKDILKDIKAKQIYLVLDACYSGMFFTQRAIEVEKSHPRYLQEITKRKARQALTAGGKEPVSDGGYKNHSAFTGAFLEALDSGYADYNGDGIITASEINAYIQPKVAEMAEQTPEYGSLPGSEGGEFVFVASDTAKSSANKLKVMEAELTKLKAERERAETQAQELEAKHKAEEMEKQLAEERSRKEEAEKRVKKVTAETTLASFQTYATESPTSGGNMKLDYTKVQFPHRKHQEMVLEFTNGDKEQACKICHHTKNKGEDPKACRRCHAGKEVTATGEDRCLQCHPEKKKLGDAAPWKAKKGESLKLKDIFHVLCRGCHAKLKTLNIKKPAPVDNCEGCHPPAK